VRFVTGQEFISVNAAATNVGHPEIAALGDHATATVVASMSGGTLAQLSGMRRDPNGYDVRLEVFGPGGAVAAGWSERTPITSTEPGVAPNQDPILTFWDRFDAAYRLQLEAFVRVAAGEEAPASTPEDAYQDLRVAVACGRSVAEGRTVLLAEIE
jgi:myo-inositol 2-dehydrogenase/D-chiro-inositol 1-dehydrogenase